MINIAFADREKLLGIVLPSLYKQWKLISFNTVTISIWEIFNKIKLGSIVDIHIVLVHLQGLSLKELSGIKHFHDKYPHIKIVGISSHPDLHLIRLSISMGASAYCCLSDHDDTLEQTILETHKSGHVVNKYVKKEFFCLDFNPYAISLFISGINISKTQAQILALIPTDFTYKQIANKINLSPKTIDRHREILFEKLNIKSRQGLALFAVKHGFFEIK